MCRFLPPPRASLRLTDTSIINLLLMSSFSAGCCILTHVIAPPRERFCLSEHFARVTDSPLNCSRHGPISEGCPYCRSHVPCTRGIIECKVSVCDNGPLY